VVYAEMFWVKIRLAWNVGLSGCNEQEVYLWLILALCSKSGNDSSGLGSALGK